MTILYTPNKSNIPPRELRRMIACGTEVPEECIKRAQVVIVTEGTWHILAPAPFKMRFSRLHTPIPETVTCPIVDISALPPTLDYQIAEVIRHFYTEQSGVLFLSSLLAGLVGLGAVVTNRPCPNCEGTTKNCNDCQFLEE